MGGRRVLGLLLWDGGRCRCCWFSSLAVTLFVRLAATAVPHPLPPPSSQAASDASEDLEEVMRLRANILNQTGSLQVQADNLAKYYRLLT